MSKIPTQSKFTIYYNEGDALGLLIESIYTFLDIKYDINVIMNNTTYIKHGDDPVDLNNMITILKNKLDDNENKIIEHCDIITKCISDINSAPKEEIENIVINMFNQIRIIMTMFIDNQKKYILSDTITFADSYAFATLYKMKCYFTMTDEILLKYLENVMSDKRYTEITKRFKFEI